MDKKKRRKKNRRINSDIILRFLFHHSIGRDKPSTWDENEISPLAILEIPCNAAIAWPFYANFSNLYFVCLPPHLLAVFYFLIFYLFSYFISPPPLILCSFYIFLINYNLSTFSNVIYTCMTSTDRHVCCCQ